MAAVSMPNRTKAFLRELVLLRQLDSILRSCVVVKVDRLLGAFQPLERLVEAFSDVETCRARWVDLVLLVRNLHTFEVFLVHLAHILVDQDLLLHQVSQIQLFLFIGL